MRVILTALPLSFIIYLTTVDTGTSDYEEQNQEENQQDQDIKAHRSDSLNYEWPEMDARFDCVVGIAADDKPLGTGVFISMDSVLTSANVVEDYVDNKGALRVHIVSGSWNESRTHEVGCITSVFGPGKNRKASKYWLQHGKQKEKENSPIHDLYTLSLQPMEEDKVESGHYVIATPFKSNYDRDVNTRRAFLVRMIWENPVIEEQHYMWGGFGYYDKQHIKHSNWMEMELYGDQVVLLDCDEWIPREWGHFVCIENVDNRPGVASGAPLFYKGRLLGVGSFMLDKNNESMLAFTDLRMYSEKMDICVNRGRLRNETFIEHGTVNYAEIYEQEAKYSRQLAFG